MEKDIRDLLVTFAASSEERKADLIQRLHAMPASNDPAVKLNTGRMQRTKFNDVISKFAVATVNDASRDRQIRLNDSYVRAVTQLKLLLPTIRTPEDVQTALEELGLDKS